MTNARAKNLFAVNLTLTTPIPVQAHESLGTMTDLARGVIFFSLSTLGPSHTSTSATAAALNNRGLTATASCAAGSPALVSQVRSQRTGGTSNGSTRDRWGQGVVRILLRSVGSILPKVTQGLVARSSIIRGGCGLSLQLQTPHGAYKQVDRHGTTYRQQCQGPEVRQDSAGGSPVSCAPVIEHHQSSEVSRDAVGPGFPPFGWKNSTAEGIGELILRMLVSLAANNRPILAQAYADAASLGRSRFNGTSLFTLHWADVAPALCFTRGRRALLRLLV